MEDETAGPRQLESSDRDAGCPTCCWQVNTPVSVSRVAVVPPVRGSAGGQPNHSGKLYVTCRTEPSRTDPAVRASQSQQCYGSIRRIPVFGQLRNLAPTLCRPVH